MNLFDYKVNSASEAEIGEHLDSVWGMAGSTPNLEIQVESYAKKIRESAHTFECWHNGVLTGLVACYLNDAKSKAGFITNVSVLDGYQRQGMGRKLIERAIEEATEMRFCKVDLEVSPQNTSAFSLYAACGFYISRYGKEKHRMTRWIAPNQLGVSVCCITYNHAPFIRQCLDGFMMQQTSFDFEVLIHDDASTDGTSDIIREYERKYPDIIKPIYQTENQYSKGRNILAIHQFPRAQGKYIAMCEGDDYWTDPYKLQKQVDFLEANPDFAICFHPVKIKKEDENILMDDHITPDVPDITNIYRLAEGNYIHTPSVVFRNNQHVIDEFSSKEYNFDYTLHMLNAIYGKIKKLPNEMAVYRIHRDGIWSSKSKADRYSSWMNVLRELISFFKNENIQVEEILKQQYGKIAYNLYALSAGKEKRRYFMEACEYNSGFVFEETQKAIEEIKKKRIVSVGKILFWTKKLLKKN